MNEQQKEIILNVIQDLLNKGYGFEDLVQYIINIHEEE